eukprot:g20199.t1
MWPRTGAVRGNEQAAWAPNSWISSPYDAYQYQQAQPGFQQAPGFAYQNQFQQYQAYQQAYQPYQPYQTNDYRPTSQQAPGATTTSTSQAGRARPARAESPTGSKASDQDAAEKEAEGAAQDGPKANGPKAQAKRTPRKKPEKTVDKGPRCQLFFLPLDTLQGWKKKPDGQKDLLREASHRSMSEASGSHSEEGQDWDAYGKWESDGVHGSEFDEEPPEEPMNAEEVPLEVPPGEVMAGSGMNSARVLKTSRTLPERAPPASTSLGSRGRDCVAQQRVVKQRRQGRTNDSKREVTMPTVVPQRSNGESEEGSGSNTSRQRRTKSTLGASEASSNLASREACRRRTRSKNKEDSSAREESESDLPLAGVSAVSFFPPGSASSQGLQRAAGFGISSERSSPGPPSTFGYDSEGPLKSSLSKGRSNRSLVNQEPPVPLGEEDDTFEPVDFVEPEPGHWDLNRSGVIPVSVFAGLWTAAACGVLFGMVYIYRFQERRSTMTGETRHQEVLKAYQLAEESALAHAQLMAADLLLPTVAAVDAVQASLAGGVLRNLSDYGTLLRILRPHFDTRKILEEVEIAEPPDVYTGISPGSVLLKRVGHEVKLLTDRDDCERVAGRQACQDDWYKDGYGIDKAWTYVPPEQFWSGPLFIRVEKDLTVCPLICWKPAFMFVKRASSTGGPKAVIKNMSAPSVVSDRLTNVLVRVVVSAEIFQDGVGRGMTSGFLLIGEIPLGEAIVSTSSGDVLAAENMASGVFIDEETGHLRVNKVWNAQNSWTQAASEARMLARIGGMPGDMVAKGQKGIYAESGAYSVSVRRLEGPSGDALDIGPTLRLVMGTPIFSFMDPLLFTLTWPACGASAVPIVVLLFGVLFGLRRRRRKKEPPGRVSSAPSMRSSSGTTRGSMLMTGNSGLSQAPEIESRQPSQATWPNLGSPHRTHLENRRTSLTEALGMKDMRKRLVGRQKTIELNQVDDPQEAPQDMVQMSEVRAPAGKPAARRPQPNVIFTGTGEN